MLSRYPKVTVIIANHNYGEYVVESINSAVEQTYRYISIVIVDSASTDDSCDKIYQNFFKKCPHNNLSFQGFDVKKTSLKNSRGDDVDISFIKLPEKLGPSYARNIAINYSIDDTFAFAILDADDVMYPNKVSRFMNEMMSMPSLIGVVYADYDTLNIENEVKQIENKTYYSQDKLLDSCIVHSGSLVSRPALMKVKNGNEFYDNQLLVAEDWDLWIRISRHFMIIHIPEVHTLVRVTPKNTTNTVNNNIWQQCWSRIREKINAHQ